MHRVMLVIGTRPEAIKMAPVARALLSARDFSLHLCTSGQHREMLHQALALFHLRPDADLGVMQPNQTLNGLMQAMIGALDVELDRVSPELVMVHGDTATCFAASLAAFHQHIPVVHVEAGLRTGDLQSPWPEEAYRSLVARLAVRHYAPTTSARDNLVAEGITPARIRITGNTVIDALTWMSATLTEAHYVPGASSPLRQIRHHAPLVLITGHRRENHGQAMASICDAIAMLAERYPDTDFVYPVHLNPAVKDVVSGRLGGIVNVLLVPPQDYRDFVWLMGRATLILTDSGGIQEEAPSLGVPVLVMRQHSERHDALAAGTVILVGSATDDIVVAVSRLLDDPEARRQMSSRANPYGDGLAAATIINDLRDWLSPGPGAAHD
ncbi:non-hydrolyzing UDP-N-acetylglucosamine 2-epimerase [Halomonas sp. V046]|uniref:non-hydrolyzing UDP-N-acetylglucosamine 2-epimerase n=1 Tax=Halomonas sp. V046 TaxID=3459611 RepID=UPI0040442E4E